MRCGKFGVAVCKASMLNWRRGSICHRCMGIVLYIYIDLPLDVPSLVQWYSRHLCSIKGGQCAMGICALCYI